MKAVLITGNPKFINNKVAQDYYQEIISFLEQNGVEVTVDPGADYTCPPKADFYIGHSRGASRIRCFERTNQLNDFLRFGDIGEYIDPVDELWQKTHPPGSNATPPKEHFVFIDSQKQAILRIIASKRPTSRQSPSRGGRPQVR